MVHGAPDWYGISPKGQTYVLQDDAELAARLGAPNKWERRGDTIWFDTFESGLGTIQVTGAGAALEHYLSTDDPFQGGNVLCVEAGNVAGNHTDCTWFFPVPVLGVWGFAGWVSFNAALDHIDWSIRYADGTNWHEATIRYDHPAQELSILVDGTVWEVLDADIVLNAASHHYHLIKLVVDFDGGTYNRLIVDNHTYVLSDYIFDTLAIVVVPRVALRAEVYNIDGAVASVNLDSLIWTINEPT